MPSRKRPYLEMTTSPAPVQAASAMNEYINTQLTPGEQAHPAHALAPPEPAASANSRRRLGPGPASPAPPARPRLNQLSLDDLMNVARFLPLHDMDSLARVSRQTARIPIERVAQVVPPLRGVSLTLRECYARVKPMNETPLKKSWIETEEQSLKALNMEHGGARHFFQANDMLQYILRNWSAHSTDEVVIVIPNLRQRIFNVNAPPWRRALASAGYPVSGTPAVVESVTGTESYRQRANLLEYRVGFYESDQVISMSAAHFVGTIAAQEATLQRDGTGYFECGLRFDELHVPIRISFKRSDFFSAMYVKNVLEIKDYQETLNKFRRRD